jgi:uncharacterized membrane protein YhaH (DUF805 family)
MKSEKSIIYVDLHEIATSILNLSLIAKRLKDISETQELAKLLEEQISSLKTQLKDGQ